MDIVEPGTINSALKVKDKDAGDVGKFLNRILGLSVHRQNLVRPGVCFSDRYEPRAYAKFSNWAYVHQGGLSLDV